MKISELIKSAIVIVVIFAVFGLAAFGLNFYTQPLIDANNAGAQLAPLIEVLPTGKNFSPYLYTGTNGKLPDNITNMYIETNGAGYVFEVSATGYQSGLVIRVGIDSNGVITGSSVVSSNETWGHETLLNGKYNGQTISSAELIIAAGATSNSATSNGYFNAVKTALQAYTIISGGKLDPSVVIEGIVSYFHTGLCNGETIVGDEISASGNILKGWTAKNGSGAAYIMSKGDEAILVVVNASGYAKAYDAEKNDITDENAALIGEALENFGTPSTNISKAITNKVKKLFGEECVESIERVELTTFNTVCATFKFTNTDGKTVYMIQSKPYTYGNNAMNIYTFIGEDGKIIKQDVATLIYDHYSVPGYESSTSDAYVAWLEKYTGKDAASLGDDLLISGATLSSTATRNATADAFAAFESIKGGAQ